MLLKLVNPARVLAAAAVLLLSFPSALPASAMAAPPSKIIAIGDLHGDYDAYFTLMRAAGLVDARGKWTGGSTVFVQTGDVPDRGPDSKKIVEHLMKLEKAAPKKGGAVIAIIGNHEAMNVTGDLRYVTQKEYAAFATGNSKRLRDDYFTANRARLTAHYRAIDPNISDDGVRASYNAEVPLGYLEHRAAWNVSGKIGAWVAAHDALHIVGETLFVHGGVSSAYVQVPLGDMNQRIRDSLKLGGGNILTDEHGPLWYRGNTVESPAGEAEVNAALAAYGVKRIVIGHTPSLAGIKSLYGGKLVMIDTGISSYFGGTKSYLMIEGGTATTVDNGAARKIGGVK